MDDGFTGFTIGIAGLGLIGGSLARAFKSAGFHVTGYDRDPGAVKAALDAGAVDTGGCEPEPVCGCDYVFLALYPDGIIDFVLQNVSLFKKDAVVIDCCGVKGYICGPLFGAAQMGGFHFIGGHPMAGTEKNGFSASSEALFHGASFILTPHEGEDKALVEKVAALVRLAGFGRVVITTVKHHDRMIAFTSQLPHVIACAYVMSTSCPYHEGYSAGSFRDVSRVAHINAPLWAELFDDNKEALCAEIDEMIENMKKIRQAAAADDRQALIALLEQARRIKDSV